MENQRRENLLNLSLSISEKEREKSRLLESGFTKEGKIWTLIIRYHGDIMQYADDEIKIVQLFGNMAIVRIPQKRVDEFSNLEQVDYIEKPKPMYF